MDVNTVGFAVGPVAERLTIFTPLGIRFWDPARDAQVSDGLTVVARAAGTRGPRRRANRTNSGIYAFTGLPGLREVEYPQRTDTIFPSPLTARRFVVEVEDGQRRFLPMVFAVDVPFLGVFPSGPLDGGTLGGPPGLFLFSAPTRPATATLAAVRADLEAVTTDGGMTTLAPAAHAVLEVRAPGQPPWFGIADGEGRVAVLFPYPSFAAVVGGEVASPLAPTPRRWAVEVRVRYEPDALVVHPGASVPDLRSVFEQAPGRVRPTRLGAGAFLPQMATEVDFGRELVLRTDAGSTLEVTTAGP